MSSTECATGFLFVPANDISVAQGVALAADTDGTDTESETDTVAPSSHPAASQTAAGVTLSYIPTLHFGFCWGYETFEIRKRGAEGGGRGDKFLNGEGAGLFLKRVH